MGKTFIDDMPKTWAVRDLSDTRISLMREGVVTLVGIKKLESEALFVSSEGGGTLRETAKVEFAGKERYWWIARKVNGVIRRALLSQLDIKNCSVDEPCIKCEVCALLGGLNTATNESLYSRVKLQDLISLQPFVYDEKFRVRLPDNTTDPSANPTPFQEVVVPPGTMFPFITRIIKPSQRDLALFLFGNRIADGLGYGNYSKMRGDATTNWMVLSNGFLHVSVHDLLEKTDESGSRLEDQIELVAQKSSGVDKDKILTGDALNNVVEKLTASIRP